jgi:hypothetical protein
MVGSVGGKVPSYLKHTLECFEILSYLKCTFGFLRGSLILEAFNVPLNLATNHH